MMALTLYEFNALDSHSQANIVFTEGAFIDDRDEDGLKVQLYGVNDFYVEVYYDPKANEIVRYRSFKSSGQLGPYIKMY